MFLYCIANSQGLCKFGFSGDPHRRLRALQTGSSDTLVLLETVAVDDQSVRSLERLLHQEFGHLRVRGEWFDCTPEQGVNYLRWFAIHYL